MPGPKTSRAYTARPAPADWRTSSLGERVDHICRIRGWSLKRLGDESGFDSGVITRLAQKEATIAGAPDTLARVAKAAGVHLEWLLLGEGPIEVVPHTTATLRSHPEWDAVVKEAKEWQIGIPDEFWDLAGDTVFPTPVELDWQLVVGLVRELYSAHQRRRAEARRRGEPETPRVDDSGPAPTKAGWGGGRRRQKDDSVS